MDWGKVSAWQFEQLSCDFAKSNYSEFCWEPTAQTKDGNRDGEFIEQVKSINHLYKGWYESKYTKTPFKSIPRSHMDSTLVSGILDGHVVFILFITNGKIAREFKRRANAILKPHRIEVNFIDGEQLERWICDHPDIYNKYFSCSQESLTQVSNPKVEIDDVCFFDGILSSSDLSVPISILHEKSEYYLYLGVRSDIQSEYTIKVNCSNVKIYDFSSPRSSHLLQKGYNSIFVKCLVLKAFQGSFNVSLILDDPRLTINSHSIEIEVQENYAPQIIYTAQTCALQEMSNYLQATSSDNTLLVLKGSEGSGKSHLLRTLLESLTNQKNECLTIQFSERKAENACSLCKLILFLNFGRLFDLSDSAFSDLISSSLNLPLEFFMQLKAGIKNQIVALNVITYIIKLHNDSPMTYAILPQYNMFSHRYPSYILVDDVQKLDEEYSTVFTEIITEFVSRKFSQILIMGFRPKEFYSQELENKIYDFNSKSWTLGELASKDISDTLTVNFNYEIGHLTKIFPKPLNVLHLIFLIKQLHNQDIIHKQHEDIYRCFMDAYRVVNMQKNNFAKSKLANPEFPEFVSLIYSVETGIPRNILSAYCGSDFGTIYSRLISDDIIREKEGKIFPFHDACLYAFKDGLGKSRDTFKILNCFLEFLLQQKTHDAVLESKLISILIENGSNLSTDLQISAFKLCEDYYNSSQYVAAKYIANALLPNLDDICYDDFDYQKLRILYIYAQCIKFTETHTESTKYFERLIEIADELPLPPSEVALAFDAQSEILNNAIWCMDFQQATQCINQLEKMSCKSIGNMPVHWQNSYLNFLNRKILFRSFILDNNCLLEYQCALSESERMNRLDYIGYAKMDYAKTLFSVDPEQAVNLMEEANVVFSESKNLRRRFLECQAELCFLKAIAFGENYEKLYSLQREMLSNNYIHSYTKTTIKILTIELSQKVISIENIQNRLERLILQNPDIPDNKRIFLSYCQLRAALSYCAGRIDYMKEYNIKLLNVVSCMSSDYQVIPEHNQKLTNSTGDFVWGFKKNIHSAQNLCKFILDPRIW